jgi:MFS family permease
MNASIPIQRAAATAVPPSVWQTVRAFPRPVWCLLAGMFINRFGTFVIPFLALHITRLGYSARQSGLALGAYGAGHFIASAVGGHLADTLGCRRTIIGSMACGAVCMLLLSQAHDLGWLIALAFLTGLTGEFYRPASSALLANLVPEGRHVTAFAAYRFAINAGFAFGPAVAGFLARHSYFWLFAGNAATSVLYGVIALVLLPRDGAAQANHLTSALQAGTSLKAACREAARDRRFVRLLVATFAVALVFVQMLATLGLAIKAAGLSDEIYGLVLGFNGVLIVLFEIPLTTFTQRRPPLKMMALGFALIGFGSALFGWGGTPWHFALGMAVLTAGEMFSMPVAMAYVANLAPGEMRGRYMGLYGLTWAAALACGPALGTLTFSWSPAALWSGCGLAGVLAALFMVRTVDRPTATAKT